MTKQASPLNTPLFKRAWLASILTYIALMVQGVGVAWLMVEIADNDAMVAWVQSAIYLPLMLLSIPAGAIADVFNKKAVTLIGLVIALTASLALFLLTYFSLITPFSLLFLCILTGIGMAIYDPAWQTAVPLIVPEETLPQAISLRSMSQNMARAIAPAIGGIIVAWFGGTGTFLSSTLLFLPFILVIALWSYTPTPARLPPERIDHAITTGLRYIANSPLSRLIILRGFLLSSLGIGLLALMPLVVKQLLQGGSIQYGILLGAFGLGAVAAAKILKRVRDIFTSETLVTLATGALALGAFAMAILTNIYLLSIILVISGMGWLTIFSTLNTRIQMLSPRWIMGRTFATYAAATTAGMVVGSLIWGQLIASLNLQVTLLIVGAGLLFMLFADNFAALPIADGPGSYSDLDESHGKLDLAITYRSGPICIQKEYMVAAENARPFYRAMQKLERVRLRNGAYNWSLSREISDQTIWIERYHMLTWLDYLRMRERHTERDSKIQRDVKSFIVADSNVTTRYQLERPIGSVRWSDDVIDNKITR